MSQENVPVLIVGGGLTGLSAAVFLAHHGVRATLVERHPGTSTHPKARAINPRTMELFRAVGMEERVTAGRSPISGNTDLVHVETLAGAERVRMPNASVEDISRISPARWTLIDQNQLEPILRGRAEEVGVDLRFHTRLDAVTETADGVTATLTDVGTGESTELRAAYVIAADGSRSPVRDLLSIGSHGRGTLTNLVSFFFDADLEEPLRGRKIIAAYVNNPQARHDHPARQRPQVGHQRLLLPRQGPERRGLHPGALRRTGPRRRRRTGSGADPRLGRHARLGHLGAGGGHLRPRPLPGGRGRRARDAAHRGLRRQHRHPGRLQPGLEARPRAGGQGRARAARELRRGTPPGRGGDRPAGDAAVRGPRGQAVPGRRQGPGRRDDDDLRLRLSGRRVHRRGRRGREHHRGARQAERAPRRTGPARRDRGRARAVLRGGPLPGRLHPAHRGRVRPLGGCGRRGPGAGPGPPGARRRRGRRLRRHRGHVHGALRRRGRRRGPGPPGRGGRLARRERPPRATSRRR
ncbi:FAD-dependent monooxygenase [Streptomyces sp. RB110-2]|nr:FAD-dependent monooxygenase [Streptomyces sp. RB110-2]